MFSDFLDVEHHWGDVSGGKWSMRENGVIKQPGSSWISINDWWMNFLLVQNHFLKGIAFVLSWMDWRKQWSHPPSRSSIILDRSNGHWKLLQLDNPKSEGMDMLWCIFPLQFPSVLGPNSFGFRWFYHTKICSLPKVRVHREGLTFLQTPKRQGAFMHRAASLPFSEAKVLLKCGNCLHATKYLFLMPKDMDYGWL